MNIDKRKALMIQCLIDCEAMCVGHKDEDIEEV